MAEAQIRPDITAHLTSHLIRTIQKEVAEELTRQLVEKFQLEVREHVVKATKDLTIKSVEHFTNYMKLQDEIYIKIDIDK